MCWGLLLVGLLLSILFLSAPLLRSLACLLIFDDHLLAGYLAFATFPRFDKKNKYPVSSRFWERSQPVGEIRTRFKLVNATDDVLARHGQIPSDRVRSYEATALVDTGAVRSVVPVQVIQQLGVGIRGQRVAEYADGRRETVGVTEPLLFDWQGRDTLEEALVLGDEVLIGQTVLEKLDLLADCATGRLIPNPAHPDQPVSKVK